MRLHFFFRSRWLIVAPALLASIFSFIASASAVPAPGLSTSYYLIDEIPPIKSDTRYSLCGSEVENNINRSYDGEPYQDCTVNLFMVHMTGFITIPQHQTIQFWLASDDGGTINVDGHEWGNWGDQGCSATESGQIDISAGTFPLNLWMYENGGGTCLMLAWSIDGQGWQIVPDSAFTTNGIPSTTTIQETTTWASTTTFTTSTTSSSTIAPSTTVPAINPSTTSIPQTTSTIQPMTTPPMPPATVPLPPIPESTSPDTQPAPPVTLPAVLQPLLPPITFPELKPNTTVQTSQTLPFVTIPATMPLPPDTLPQPPQAPQTSPPAKDAPLSPIADKAVVEALANIDQATPTEVKAVVTELLTHALSTDQAVSVASEPAVLAVLTNDEATQVFEQVTVEELTTDQAVQLVAAVQEAPTKVRKAFEAVLNLFQGFADDYTMTNQTVPIKTRRALIALGAVFLVAAPAKNRRVRR